MKDNGIIEIGDNYNMVNTNISCDKDARINLGKNGNIARNGTISAEENAVISFRIQCTFRVGAFIVAHRDTSITFGNDCMVAAQFHARSDDGHSIFDLTNSTKLNDQGVRQRKIVLGDHVWVGYDCMLTYGTNLGNNSIVGSKSLVRSTFPGNCIVAGTPAKIIRENIDWARDAKMSFDVYSGNPPR